MAADPAVLLDVSRLLSRLNKGPATGIDRVEAEWLAELSASRTPHLLLARGRRCQLLLPAEAGPAILRWSRGELDDLPPIALVDRLRGRSGAHLRAERHLRQMAILRSPATGGGIANRVIDLLGGRAVYLNVGHSNLTQGLWRALHPLCRVALIHDTIPLDHPEFTRAGQSEKFRDRFIAAVGEADLVLTISQATRNAVIAWRDRLNLPANAPVVTAPIGTRLAKAEPGRLPDRLALDRPYFVTLGTIEPRKNHALLLDVWDELSRRLPADALPRLFIIGRRGWENRETFARLDRLPADGVIRELSGLDDGQVAALLEHSHGMLMPSRAEGFGLPYTEAAARGVPVICAPLPVARELLGSYARYHSPDDCQSWADCLADIAAAPAIRLSPQVVPEWNAHFALVRKAMQERLLVHLSADMPR